MYEYISGTLSYKGPDRVVIDAAGIGYRCQVPASLLESLPEVGEDVQLYTYLHVREDAQELFGFSRRAERAFFEVLMGVSGIGPRLALSALGAYRPNELQQALVRGDTGILTEISGVGRKTAERMIVELRDRVADLDLGDGVPSDGSEREVGTGRREDARDALVSLGLSKSDAERSLRKALRETDVDPESTEELVRLALRQQ